MTVVRQAFLLLVLTSVLVGVVYPLAFTSFVQVAMPERAGGSLVVRSGRVVGSQWIGQNFEAPGRFWGRLSATGPAPYQADASSGSNLSPFGEAFRERAVARFEALREADPVSAELVPVDLITASGSGLDPHISPEAAYYQAERVAGERNLSRADVEALIAAHVEGRTVGILGQPRVNVLLLNLSLEDMISGAEQ